jgi:hypothetical protein
MARIRTIKPEMFQDEKLAPLAAIDRFVFIGLISMADDAGRLLDSVKLIDGTLFPETDESSRDSLDNLARTGRVCRYTVESGQKLLQITNWSKHQKVDNPAKYVLQAPPPQPVTATPVIESSRESREDVATPSRSDLRPTTYDLRPTTNTKAPSPSARAELLALMPSGRRVRFVAEEEMWLGGAHLAPGMRATPADVEYACGDWLQKSPEGFLPDPPVMRSFVERAIRERTANAGRPPPTPIGAYSRPNGRVSRNEQQYIDSRTAVGLPPYSNVEGKPDDDRT